jgi:hypothetical protein
MRGLIDWSEGLSSDLLDKEIEHSGALGVNSPLCIEIAMKLLKT